MKTKYTFLKRILDALAILTFLATFSPLVIPQNKTVPFLVGMPYTMWIGLLISVLFILLAYLVSKVQKAENHAD